MNKSGRRSLSAGLLAMVAAMVLFSTACVGALAYVSYRADTVSMHSARCLSIAMAVAAAVDGDGLERALATGEKDEQWGRVKAFADRVAAENGLTYLYITNADHSSGFFTYYAEGWNPATGDPQLDFLYEEVDDIYAPPADEAIASGGGAVTGIYDSSGEGFDYGRLVTGYAAISSSDGRVVGLVGVDISMETALANVNAYALRTGLIVAGCIAVFTLAALRFINTRVRRPVALVSAAAERLAAGEVGAPVMYAADDEIGALSFAFNRMSDSIAAQIEVFKQVAQGDLSVGIVPRGERDELAFAMRATVENLRQMLDLFRKSAESVDASAERIAEESARVSKDANSEIAACGGIGASVSVILGNTQENAGAAGRANDLITETAQLAMEGSVRIERMVDAVEAIRESYSSITRVADSIDAIAFQTNILALNASVEAARAGKFGRGFAVVADEVGSLAAKSSASAKQAGELVENALRQVAAGADVAKRAAQAFDEIVRKIGESGAMIGTITAASAAQAQSIARINEDIGLMNDMIRRTAASAQSSASVSDALSGRAKQLAGMLERYRIS